MPEVVETALFDSCSCKNIAILLRDVAGIEWRADRGAEDQSPRFALPSSTCEQLFLRLALLVRLQGCDHGRWEWQRAFAAFRLGLGNLWHLGRFAGPLQLLPYPYLRSIEVDVLPPQSKHLALA